MKEEQNPYRTHLYRRKKTNENKITLNRTRCCLSHIIICGHKINGIPQNTLKKIKIKLKYKNFYKICIEESYTKK